MVMRYPMQRWSGVGLTLAFAICSSQLGAQSPEDAEAASSQPLAESAAWREQVLNIEGAYARPVTISIEGDATAVSRRDGMMAEDASSTRLVSKPGSSNTRLIVDMGVLVSGYVELGISKSTGSKVRVAYSEAREYLKDIGDASADPEDFFYNGRTLGTDDDPDGRVDVFSPSGNKETLTSAGLRGSQRFIAVSLDEPGTVEIDFIRVRQTNYPGRYDGHFLSSDPALNQAWYGSAYSIDLSTIRDFRKSPEAPWVIIDGPKRDRVVYAQDLWPVALSGFNQGADYRRIIRDSLNLFACQQYPDGSLPAASLAYVPCDPSDPGPADGPPEGFGPPGEIALARLDGFSIWWVILLADYVQFSGDEDFGKAMLPVARRILDFTGKNSPDGVLFRTDNYDGKYGFSWHTPDLATGIDSSINAAYFAALLKMANLERSFGNGDDAALAYSNLAQRVKRAVNEQLWDTEAEAMVLNSEDPRRDHTVDANTVPLLFDILDGERPIQAMAFLQNKLGQKFGTANSEYSDNPYMSQYISPYMMALETIGRMRNHDAKGALDLIRKAWPHMMADAGTPWEEMGLDGRPNIPRPGSSLTDGEHVDLAHAWSTAVPALSMYVLGVRPEDIGYSRWIIEPQTGDLEWAQGEIPIPGGTIASRWTTRNGFKLTMAAPIATSGTVSIPLAGKARTIAMDGEVVWSGGQPASGVVASKVGDRVIFEQIRGSHTFAWLE